MEMRLIENETGRSSSCSARSDVCRFTEDVIAALTAWDAAALHLLAQQAAAWNDDPPEPKYLVDASLQLRLLGALLRQTERNLRVFRDSSPIVSPLSSAGTYRSISN